MDLLIAAVPAAIAAIAAVASAYITSKTKDSQEKAAREGLIYREQREKLDKAKSKVILSTMEGVTVLLHHAHGDKLNGNVEAALNNIYAAKNELTDVRSEIAAKI